MDPLRPGTISKEMENETAMSSVRRCAYIRIDTLEFIQHFESTSEIVVTMSMENRRSKKLISQRFSANNGEPRIIEINGEFQLFYSHNVKNHRDPILRFAVENTRAKTFTRHRSIAASLVSMQQVVQHDFDGMLTLYESHVTEKNPIGRICVHIRSVYADDEESSDGSEENDQEPVDDNDSSEGENQRGIHRISRSIKHIFSSSSGLYRQQSLDTITAERPGSPPLPDRLDLEDINMIASPMRNRLSRRYRNPNTFFSDGGSGCSSRAQSVDIGANHQFDGQPSDAEVSSSMESGNGENQWMLLNTLQLQLQEYKEHMRCEPWKPFVLLLQQTPENKLLVEHMTSTTSQYGMDWRKYTVLLREEECIDCIRSVYSFYNEKITEHDLEPFRVLFVGDDAFLWHLLVAYLLLVNNSPNETLNLLFLPLSLPCSLSQWIACQSMTYLQVILTINQAIQSIAQNKTKGITIEPSLINLLKTDYALKPIAIHEISLQRSCTEKELLFGNPEIVRFLSNDQGIASKLKIPYLFSVSIGTTLAFSPSQYTNLIEQVKNGDAVRLLPDLQPEKQYTTREEDVVGILDYWLCSDQKQVTFESKNGIRCVSVQRDGEGDDLKLILNLSLSTLNNKKKKMLVNKYSLVDRGKKDEEVEGYECIINKMMLAPTEEETICVDGITIENVSFMTVSNRYFSRMKTFPICIPFVESNYLSFC